MHIDLDRRSGKQRGREPADKGKKMKMGIENYDRRSDAVEFAMEAISDWVTMLSAKPFLASIAAGRCADAAEITARAKIDLGLPEERLNLIGLDTWDLYSAVISLGLGEA